MKDKIKIIYKGGMVKRYHNRPILHVQNNAEHQYLVASIAILLYPEIDKQLLINILWHDIYEYETGDMPWIIKLENPNIKKAIVEIEEKCKIKYNLTTNLNEQEHHLLKLAEYFECMIFCLEERKLGNTEFNQSFIDCINCIADILKKIENKDIIKRSNELLIILSMENVNV